MALFRVTVKNSATFNGTKIEKGMSVDVPIITNINPISVNGWQPVNDAFKSIFGLNVEKAESFSTAYMEYKQFG